MSRRIIITQEDMQKLKKLVDAEVDDAKNKPHVLDLDNELKRAEIVSKNEIPDDIITMNSSVLLSLDGMDETITLVYPHEADVDNNMLSVLSPIGTAIIGFREGDVVEWAVPSGITIIDIKKVIYQPEAVEKAALTTAANKQI